MSRNTDTKQNEDAQRPVERVVKLRWQHGINLRMGKWHESSYRDERYKAEKITHTQKTLTGKVREKTWYRLDGDPRIYNTEAELLAAI